VVEALFTLSAAEGGQELPAAMREEVRLTLKDSNQPDFAVALIGTKDARRRPHVAVCTRVG
jgi:hypothetical protein